MDLDATTTVIAVVHCPDCPFYRWNEELDRVECKLKERDDPRELPAFEYEDIGSGRIRVHPPIPPAWCPLRGSPVVVMVTDREDNP